MKKQLILVITLAFAGLQPEAKSTDLNRGSYLISNVTAGKPGLTEEEKINKLIEYVRNLPGATFSRNGKDYTPVKAADHLQSKYNKHKKKIKTAQDFVKNIATNSATNEPYQIHFQDGNTIKCGDLLQQELEKLEHPSWKYNFSLKICLKNQKYLKSQSSAVFSRTFLLKYATVLN